MRESKIEARLRDLVKEHGGLCYKFVSPGNQGVPDRIIIVPGGRIVFAELKADKGRTRPLQDWRIAEMRRRGADVRVIKGMLEVESLVAELFPQQKVADAP